MSSLQVFVQGEGFKDVALFNLPAGGNVADAIVALRSQSKPPIQGEDAAYLYSEDAEEPLLATLSLPEAGLRPRSRVHLHRCLWIDVTVMFNGRPVTKTFRPAATVRRVKVWAVHDLGMSVVDGSDHVLQLCNTTQRPDEDVHIGTLVDWPTRALCFDLVPRIRVEG